MQTPRSTQTHIGTHNTYTHTATHKHTHRHADTCMHIYTLTRIHIYPQTDIHRHTYIDTQIHAHRHTYTHTHICKQTHKDTHAHKDTLRYKCIQTHRHTDAHAQTHTQEGQGTGAGLEGDTREVDSVSEPCPLGATSPQGHRSKPSGATASWSERVQRLPRAPEQPFWKSPRARTKQTSPLQDGSCSSTPGARQAYGRDGGRRQRGVDGDARDSRAEPEPGKGLGRAWRRSSQSSL